MLSSGIYFHWYFLGVHTMHWDKSPTWVSSEQSCCSSHPALPRWPTKARIITRSNIGFLLSFDINKQASPEAEGFRCSPHCSLENCPPTILPVVGMSPIIWILPNNSWCLFDFLDCNKRLEISTFVYFESTFALKFWQKNQHYQTDWWFWQNFHFLQSPFLLSPTKIGTIISNTNPRHTSRLREKIFESKKYFADNFQLNKRNCAWMVQKVKGWFPEVYLLSFLLPTKGFIF